VAESGHLYFIRYDYIGSGEPQRCGFICRAENGRAAAESFANQHPGLWFQLISVNNGSIEAFWSAEHMTFYTIPDREELGL
jgi:hypothetical protein